MFAVWQNVPSASIAYNRAGIHQRYGRIHGWRREHGALNTTRSTATAADGGQSPIIYDAAAAIFIALGVDETSVIGFAGPCAIDPAQGRILTGNAVMNGLFQDGAATSGSRSHGRGVRRDLRPRVRPLLRPRPLAGQRRVRHGLLRRGRPRGPADDDFPFLVTEPAGHAVHRRHRLDLEALPGRRRQRLQHATHGTITGIGVLLGRRVARPARQRRRAPRGQRRHARPTRAARPRPPAFPATRSRIFSGNPINEPDDMPLGPFGSQKAARHRPLRDPAAARQLHDRGRDRSARTSPKARASAATTCIAMPGTAPAPLGPITVTAGQTSSGNDVTLIGTPPRFDAVRGPVKNPLQNGWRAPRDLSSSSRSSRPGGGGGGDNGGGGGGPLNITTATADDGMIGAAYSETIAASGGRGAKILQHQRRARCPPASRLSAAGTHQRDAGRSGGDRRFHRVGQRLGGDAGNRHAGAFDRHRRAARHRDGERARHRRGRPLQRRHRHSKAGRRPTRSAPPARYRPASACSAGRNAVGHGRRRCADRHLRRDPDGQLESGVLGHADRSRCALRSTSRPRRSPTRRGGTSYSDGVVAQGGLPPFNWSLTGGTLPAGLSGPDPATGVISAHAGCGLRTRDFEPHVPGDGQRHARGDGHARPAST